MPSSGKTWAVLILGFGALFMLMVGLGSVGIGHMESMQVSRELVGNTYEKSRLAVIMREAIRKRSFSLLLTPTLDSILEREAEQHRFDGYAREFLVAREQLLAIGTGEEEAGLLRELEQRVRAKRPLVEGAMQAAVRGAKGPELRDAMDRAFAANSAVLKTLDEIVEKQAELGDQRAKEISTKTRDALELLVGFGALIFAAGLFIAVFVVRRERWLSQTLESRVRARTRELTQEVTERRRVEEALRKSENRFRDFADASSDWYWEMDENLRYSYISENYSKIVDIDRQELIGKTRQDLPIPGQDEEDWQRLLADLNAKRPFRNFIHPRTNADGRVVHLSINGKPIFNQDGKFIGYRGTGTDVTELKKAEIELREAKEKAESASRTKSAFLANMSHELRTPLNAVIGFSETMQHQIFGALGNEKYEEYVDCIHESGEHLLSLINDILDLSKIEARKLVLREEVLDMAEEADAGIRSIQLSADARGVSLEVDIPAKLPKLFADRRGVRQILLNLLSNAVKFTPEGGTISMAVYIADNGCLRVAITDTGIGMDEKGIATALTSFGQAESAIANYRKGTGLGLPLAKGLTEVHGGTLEIESKPGVGTSITVTFPKARVLDNGKAPSAAAIPEPVSTDQRRAL